MTLPLQSTISASADSSETTTPTVYITIIAAYLSQVWGDAFYFKSGCESNYDAFDLNHFPVDGLTESAILDLRQRELSSYAHRIIWDPSQEERLIS